MAYAQTHALAITRGTSQYAPTMLSDKTTIGQMLDQDANPNKGQQGLGSDAQSTLCEQMHANDLRKAGLTSYG